MKEKLILILILIGLSMSCASNLINNNKIQDEDLKNLRSMQGTYKGSIVKEIWNSRYHEKEKLKLQDEVTMMIYIDKSNFSVGFEKENLFLPKCIEQVGKMKTLRVSPSNGVSGEAELSFGDGRACEMLLSFEKLDSHFKIELTRLYGRTPPRFRRPGSALFIKGNFIQTSTAQY